MELKNLDLEKQSKIVHKILKKNKVLWDFLELLEKNITFEYYIGAGVINQTIWNYLSNFELNYGIKDLDFVYFDKNITEEEEKILNEKINTLGKDLNLEIDIKNQAKVHFWYKNKFGFEIEAYESLESAINTWPTTATAIGVRKEKNKLKIYAPYGLNDIFSKTVRPNKILITENIYEKKYQRWLEKWEDLKIIDWSTGKELIFIKNTNIKQEKEKLDLIIKDYDKKYFEDCVCLFHEVYSETYSEFENRYLEKQRFADILSIYTIPNSKIYLAFFEHKLVGFVTIDGDLIENIYIKKEFQNKGIGSIFIDKLKKERKMLTTYVFMCNKKALEFFSKKGFRILTDGFSNDENQPDFFLSFEKKNSFLDI
ncbi:MAG: nucleotidyltransferase family protein [Cyanobacteriota bacterium]